MQIKVFTIPIASPETMEEEANRFLRGHRVMTVDRQFTPEGGGYWTVFITFQDGTSTNMSVPGISRSGKVDYREVLSPEDFIRFAKYRDIRKELATQQGIPAYAVFTDDELAQMARMGDEMTVAKIGTIKGVGKRAEKYGTVFISAISDMSVTSTTTAGQ